MAGKRTTDLDQAIGAAIRERREAMQMNQSELGRGIGVTFQQIQKYEKASNRVSAAALVRIAEVLGCSTNDLLGVGEASALTASEVTLLKNWKPLTEDQKGAVLRLIQSMSI